MSFNDVVGSLKPYPMEELAVIRQALVKQGKKVYDFGTGDPKLPVWEPIRQAMIDHVPPVSQYPSVRGQADLIQAIRSYLDRRFQLQNQEELLPIPTGGSKEAIFHMALCTVGRSGGRRRIIYPTPGYPVYRSSTLFAGGIPEPYELEEKNGYRMEPWNLPKAIQKEVAAIWINYPHNPTGTEIERSDLANLIDWCQSNDTLLLSDDCYIDIYNPDWDQQGKRPLNPLELTQEGIISFMSLSKRSGLTGYRSGFMIGEEKLMLPLLRARANFGVGTPDFIQAAAVKAWSDDQHVAARRQIFFERLDYAYNCLAGLGLVDRRPEATFYLWARTPKDQDDIEFCKGLATQGVIASPSQWLSEGTKGYFRLAMVPELSEIKAAMDVFKAYVEKL